MSTVEELDKLIKEIGEPGSDNFKAFMKEYEEFRNEEIGKQVKKTEGIKIIDQEFISVSDEEVNKVKTNNSNDSSLGNEPSKFEVSNFSFEISNSYKVLTNRDAA